VVIFGKKYVLRRFGEISYVGGHETYSSEDLEIIADVQPVTRNNSMTEAGAEFSSRVKTWTDAELTPCDPDKGVKGDWLYHQGKWYQCVSSVNDNNTILSHWTSEFEQVSDTEPPTLLKSPATVKGG